MDRQLQQRVVGAAVLVGLGVIFIPIFLDDGALPPTVPDAVSIPPEPPTDFSSRVMPLDEARIQALEARTDEAIEAPYVPEVDATPSVAETTSGGNENGAHEAAGLPPGSADSLLSAVATPDPAGGPSTGTIAWTVQLGSFANDGNARRLIEKLREADFPAYLERRMEDDRTVFKVRVGPEIRREDAEKLRDRLEEKFALRGMLVRYQ